MLGAASWPGGQETAALCKGLESVQRLGATATDPAAAATGDGGLPAGWRRGEVWGLGTATLQQFEAHLGVSFRAKRVEDKARWGGLAKEAFLAGREDEQDVEGKA